MYWNLAYTQLHNESIRQPSLVVCLAHKITNREEEAVDFKVKEIDRRKFGIKYKHFAWDRRRY